MFVFLELFAFLAFHVFQALAHALIFAFDFFIAHQDERKFVFKSLDFDLLLSDGLSGVLVVKFVQFIILFGKVSDLFFVLVEFLVDSVDVDFRLVKTTVVFAKVIFILFNNAVELFDLLTLFVKLIVSRIPLLVKSN